MTGSKTRWARLVMGGAVALVVGPWSPAWGYCLFNQSATSIHVEPLDGSAFRADIPAGGQACCDRAECVDSRRGSAHLLVVSGYVPVGRNQSAGWRAECRVQLSGAEQVEVNGDLSVLHCRTR
ncbi:MAG: hypothetical protein H7831_15200 [Magnetococcus sp. WYHC-3]